MKKVNRIVILSIFFVFCFNLYGQLGNSNTTKSKNGFVEISKIIECLSNTKLSTADNSIFIKAKKGKRLSSFENNRLNNIYTELCESEPDLISNTADTEVSQFKDKKRKNKPRRKTELNKYSKSKISYNKKRRTHLKSERIFEMGDNISSSDFIGSWEIDQACVYESGFESEGECASGKEIQDYVDNIILIVNNDGSGYLAVDSQVELLTWEDGDNGLIVDIGDDDFGDFNLSQNGELTIADDYSASCFDIYDEELEDISDESECSEATGTWEEVGSMIYVFKRLENNEETNIVDSRLISKRSFWSKAKRKAKKAAKSAAKVAKKKAKAAAAAAAKAAQEATKLAEIAYDELEKQAEAFAKQLGIDKSNEVQAAVNLVGGAIDCMYMSDNYLELVASMEKGSAPDPTVLTGVLEDCEIVAEIIEIINKAGMKSIFFGASANSLDPTDDNRPHGYGATIAVSVKDLLIIWRDLADNKSPSIVPEIALQYSNSRTYTTDIIGGGLIIGWNTDEPHDTYGEFWEVGLSITALGGEVASSSTLTPPEFNLTKMKFGGLRYLGQAFSGGGNSKALWISPSFSMGKCCVLNLNNFNYRCK
tara:strand:- start:4420 stop:6201 length:1782 start_codon:yes stop_codon:yes gene_type:complete